MPFQLDLILPYILIGGVIIGVVIAYLFSHSQEAVDPS